MYNNLEEYGVVGEKTLFRDKDGVVLFVGDVVEISYGLTHYCDFLVKNGNEFFIMGIKSDCDDRTGEIRDWSVKLKKRHYKVSDGEQYSGIKMEFLRDNVNFKVGDKVKLLNSIGVPRDVKAGDTATIIKMSEDDYEIRMDKDSQVWFAVDGDLELIESKKESQIENIKEEKVVKKEFKVGDKVRIRQWDDMKKEFGVDGDGDIDCNTSFFVPEMKSLCGKEFVIEKVYDSEVVTGHNSGWTITNEMLELVVEKQQFKVGDKVKLPKTKSAGGSLPSSVIRRAKEKNQDYLYIKDIRTEYAKTLYVLVEKKDNTYGGDYFLLQDLEAYEEKKETQSPKIEILFEGRKTTVKLQDGRVGTAMRHPDDKQSEYEGVRVATARAYGVDPFPGLNPKKSLKINEELWNKFINREITVQCETKEEDNAFRKYCEEKGLRWLSGAAPTAKSLFTAGTSKFGISTNENRLCSGYRIPIIKYSELLTDATTTMVSEPVKVEPKEIEKEDFKVGDYIAFKSFDNTVDICKIEKIEDDELWGYWRDGFKEVPKTLMELKLVRTNEHMNCCYKSSAIKLSIQEEPEFKVGQKVKVIVKRGDETKYGWGGVTSGDVGIVKSIENDDSLYVDFPNQKEWHGLPSEFELVKEEDSTSEYKIGQTFNTKEEVVAAIKAGCKVDNGGYVYYEKNGVLYYKISGREYTSTGYEGNFKNDPSLMKIISLPEVTMKISTPIINGQLTEDIIKDITKRVTEEVTKVLGVSKTLF